MSLEKEYKNTTFDFITKSLAKKEMSLKDIIKDEHFLLIHNQLKEKKYLKDFLIVLTNNNKYLSFNEAKYIKFIIEENNIYRDIYHFLDENKMPNFFHNCYLLLLINYNENITEIIKKELEQKDFNYLSNKIYNDNNLNNNFNFHTYLAEISSFDIFLQQKQVNLTERLNNIINDKNTAEKIKNYLQNHTFNNISLENWSNLFYRKSRQEEYVFFLEKFNLDLNLLLSKENIEKIYNHISLKEDYVLKNEKLNYIFLGIKSLKIFINDDVYEKAIEKIIKLNLKEIKCDNNKSQYIENILLLCCEIKSSISHKKYLVELKEHISTKNLISKFNNETIKIEKIILDLDIVVQDSNIENNKIILKKQKI